MALSGAVDKKGIVDNDRIYLRFEWSATQSVAGNYSTVSWGLYLVSDGSQWGYVNASSQAAWIVNVNGVRYDGTASLGLSVGQKKLLGSGSTQVPHNADGSKTFSFTFTQYFNIYWSGVLLGSHGGSGSATLDTIPRAASIVSAPNFTDEENPTIGYSNGAGNIVTSLQACIASADGRTAYVAYRDISKTGSSYTFTLTDTERNALRTAAKNSNTLSVAFYVKTVLNGATYYSHAIKTLTIVNAAPTLSPTVKDANTATVQLTGSNAKLVRYYSNAAYTVGAAAKKGASVTSQAVTCGAKSATAASGTLAGVESGSFVFQATDSRGNTVSKTVTLPIVEYVHLSCVMDVATPTADGETVLKVNGNAYSGSFGAANNVLTVEYRESTDGGSTWDGWKTIAATANGGSYAAVANITGLDYRKAYTFQARARDALEVATSAAKTVRAFPLFDWGESDFSFNVPVSADAGITVNGFELMQKQTIGGYAGLISAHNDGSSFIRTPIQGLIPYEEGGSSSLGTAGWPFSHLYVQNVNGSALADTVVAQGASGGWNYIKFANGIGMCWNNHSTMSDTFAAWGNGYITTGVGFGAYPFAFTSNPVAVGHAYATGWTMANTLTGGTATESPTVQALRTSPISGNVTISYRIFAIGRWK